MIEMKRKRVCTNCGTEFTTSMIKVYVSKRRYCPKCKTPMFTYNDKKFMRCGKCGLKVNFSDDRQIAEMRVSMKGVSRDSRIAQLNIKKGLEVTKSFQPKHRVCQNCRNFRKRIEGMVAAKEMKSKGEVRKMSDTEILDVFHRTVKQKLRKEHQEKAKKEAEEKQFLRAQEKLKQMSVAKNTKEALIKEMTEKKKSKPKKVKELPSPEKAKK